MNHLRVITWARWKVGDTYDEKYYSIFTASVLKPSYEYPTASTAMSIVKGKHKVFMRFASIEDLTSVFVVPEEYIKRLREGFSQAISEVIGIRKHQALYYKVKDLAPGDKLINTGTGEIVAEAEQILRDNKKV